MGGSKCWKCVGVINFCLIREKCSAKRSHPIHAETKKAISLLASSPSHRNVWQGWPWRDLHLKSPQRLSFLELLLRKTTWKPTIFVVSWLGNLRGLKSSIAHQTLPHDNIIYCCITSRVQGCQDMCETSSFIQTATLGFQTCTSWVKQSLWWLQVYIMSIISTSRPAFLWTMFHCCSNPDSYKDNPQHQHYAADNLSKFNHWPNSEGWWKCQKGTIFKSMKKNTFWYA